MVPAYDAAGTLEKAVRSALREALVARCVVVDDASSDGTAGVARTLASQDPRVEVRSRPVRGGPARARNDGLDAVTTPFVCFLDADDELVPGGVAALVDAVEANRGAVCALGRFVALGPDGDDADVGRWRADQLSPVVRRHGRLIESPSGITAEALVTRLVSPPPGAWVVDTAALRALGGFDVRARRSEDLEALVRLAWCAPIVGVERDVLHYARHGEQRSAAHARRRWGRSYTLWLMLRAAPGARATLQLAHGMSAYHLALFESRRRAADRHVRALGWRNLLAAGALWAAGPVAAVLPRRALPPRSQRTVD